MTSNVGPSAQIRRMTNHTNNTTTTNRMIMATGGGSPQRLLYQIESKRVPPELVTAKVEEQFLLCLAERNHHQDDGPKWGGGGSHDDNIPIHQKGTDHNDNDNNDDINNTFSVTSKLLNLAVEYHERFPIEDTILPRLFSLACQIMIQTDHPHAVDEVYNQVMKLLNGHGRYFRVNDVSYNTHHVNDACCQFIYHVALDETIQMKIQQQPHQQQQRRPDDDQHHPPTQPQQQSQPQQQDRILQVRTLLQRIDQLYQDDTVPLVADAVAFDAYIMFLCSQHRPQEAYDMLQWMLMIQQQQQQPSANNPNIIELIPKVSTFTSIIHGYAKTLQPKKALEIIQWMLMSNHKGDRSSTSSSSSLPSSPPSSSRAHLSAIIPSPNTACFNALLHAYAMAGGTDAGQKAEQTLEWMQSLHDTEHLNTEPDSTSYNTCINAWAQSQHPNAPHHAETLLRKLVSLHETGVGKMKSMPTEEAYTAVMNAWANSTQKDAVTHVEAIVSLMEHMAVAERSNKTTATTTDHDDHHHRLRMSSFPYTILIKAWEKAAQRCSDGNEKLHCGNNALQVLDRMKEKGIEISTPTYNAILFALVETSALHATFYFLELEQQYREGRIRLDTTSFNSGLNAIAALNRPDAVEKATSVLTRMLQYAETDQHVQPSTSTYNVILKVLSRSRRTDAPVQTEKLLQDMANLPFVSPDHISYLTCILTWGRSDHIDKFDKVNNLVDRFVNVLGKQEIGERETMASSAAAAVAVFNTALSVCYHNSTPELTEAAVNTTSMVMSKLRQVQGLRPDQTTYSSWFRAVATGVTSLGGGIPNDDLTRQILDEFAQCIQDGLITPDVIQAILTLPPHALRDVSGNDIVLPTKSIPPSWCKNVKTSNRSPRNG